MRPMLLVIITPPIQVGPRIQHPDAIGTPCDLLSISSVRLSWEQHSPGRATRKGERFRLLRAIGDIFVETEMRAEEHLPYSQPK
jgi:hypothetical protein